MKNVKRLQGLFIILVLIASISLSGWLYMRLEQLRTVIDDLEDQVAKERLRRAVAFLLGQYNPRLGLVAEAPTVAPNTYWLVSDNLLAQEALESYDPETSRDIRRSLQNYACLFGLSTNEENIPISYKHEALIGEHVSLPFRTCNQLTLIETLEYVIKTDMTNASVMLDWRSYGDLLLYASLSAYYDSDGETAKEYFEEAVAMWDGMGSTTNIPKSQGSTPPSWHYCTMWLTCSKRLYPLKRLCLIGYGNSNTLTGGSSPTIILMERLTGIPIPRRPPSPSLQHPNILQMNK